MFEHIGEASMCWNPKPSNEVFASEKASDVAVRLCFKIADEVEKATDKLRGDSEATADQAIRLSQERDKWKQMAGSLAYELIQNAPLHSMAACKKQDGTFCPVHQAIKLFRELK